MKQGNVALKTITSLVDACGGLRAAARFAGVAPADLNDIVKGRASHRRRNRVYRHLGFMPVQDTPTDVLAWQIRNRVEVP